MGGALNRVGRHGRSGFIRRFTQVAWAVATNGYFTGFVEGSIYTGELKTLCVPGLNCYSCPGALGSCPIGALQAVLGSTQYRVSLYLLGFFLVVGAALGRFVCGFLCPFGLIQELLHKIPFPRKIKGFRGDRALRFLKYGILVVFVIVLPLFVVDAAGGGTPWFCELICPAGTLEAGIPLVAANGFLRETVGLLYAWKMVLLLATIFLAVVIYRPFCKYLCPLGAIYALFNRFALYRYHVDPATCTSCGECAQKCPMQLNPRTHPNHPECIRCATCKSTCPNVAITSSFGTARASTKTTRSPT